MRRRPPSTSYFFSSRKSMIEFLKSHGLGEKNGRITLNGIQLLSSNVCGKLGHGEWFATINDNLISK